MKFLLTSLLLCPGLVMAACPTGADLTNGIRVHGTDASVETYTDNGDGTVNNVYLFEPGNGSQNLLSQGIYLIQSMDLVAGKPDPATRWTYTYPIEPGKIPEPEPGGVWNAKIVVLHSGDIKTEQHVMTYGAQTTMTFGACSYDMIPIEVSYDGGDGEKLLYLPELGFALLGAFGVGADREVYTFEKIEKVAP